MDHVLPKGIQACSSQAVDPYGGPFIQPTIKVATTKVAIIDYEKSCLVIVRSLLIPLEIMQSRRLSFSTTILVAINLSFLSIKLFAMAHGPTKGNSLAV